MAERTPTGRELEERIARLRGQAQDVLRSLDNPHLSDRRRKVLTSEYTQIMSALEGAKVRLEREL